MSKHNKEFNDGYEKMQTERPCFHDTVDLEELAREGARRILQTALETEVQEYLEGFKDIRMDNGRAAAVRNGYHRAREILLSGGPVEVAVPRAMNRMGDENFISVIVPPYMRKSMKVEEAVPLLYLYGVSEKNMLRALTGLLGEGAKGLSASSVSRMKKCWEKAYEEWKTKRFDKKYCYVWVDGIRFNVQGSRDPLCTLVMIGAGADGKKELIAVEDGFRESAESWGNVLRRLKEMGMECPKLFIGDGALGFWNAAKEVYPEAKWQRCWVHKIRNILNYLPKSMHPQAKSMLKEIYDAPDEETARKAFERFARDFGLKYPKAVECLAKDIDVMLTFFQFPAEQWIHIRSTNVIESTFSTVRLRTSKMRGCGTRETILLMVFQLLSAASKRWRRLKGYEKIGMVLDGEVFKDGIRQAA